MIEFKLPAKVVQAANLLKAKDDIRYYLCGILVSEEAVVSANGHCMFFWESKIEVEKPMIVNVIDKVPAKTETIEFQINEEDPKRSIGWCVNAFGEVLSVVLVDVIQGKFPDWRKLVKDSQKPTAEIGINATYLSQLEKVVKLVGDKDFCGTKMVLNGSSESVRFDIDGPEYKSTVIIMPMRL